MFENSGSDGRCLDVTSYAGGTPATLYGCYGGVSQTWVVEDNGTISDLGSGRTMCLDVPSYVDYAPALIFPCQVTPSQVWPPW